MKNLVKIIIAAMAIIYGGNSKSNATNFEPVDGERLNYDIVYHWGLIWKSAANAELVTTKDANGYKGELYARTLPWADRIYKVRDTLQTWMMPNKQYMPNKYIKTAYEGKSVGKDTIDFSHFDNSIIGHSVRKRGDSKAQEYVMDAENSAYDMLSVFYYVRGLDYNKMQPGEEIVTTIFSGNSKEWLKIKYIGKENIKLRNGSQFETQHIQLTFSTKNQQNSSAPIDAWLEAGGTYKPILLRGTLNVGEVRVYFTGK